MRADEFFIPIKAFRTDEKPTGRGNKKKEELDKAFAMIRMGEPWKYDTITNSGSIDVMNVNANVYSVEKDNAILMRGRVVGSVIGALEFNDYPADHPDTRSGHGHRAEGRYHHHHGYKHDNPRSIQVQRSRAYHA